MDLKARLFLQPNLLSFPHILCTKRLSPGATDACLSCISHKGCPSPSPLPACHFQIYHITPSPKTTSSVKPSLTSSSSQGGLIIPSMCRKKHLPHDFICCLSYSIWDFDWPLVHKCSEGWTRILFFASQCPSAQGQVWKQQVPNTRLLPECLLKTMGQDSLTREIGTCFFCLI